LDHKLRLSISWSNQLDFLKVVFRSIWSIYNSNQHMGLSNYLLKKRNRNLITLIHKMRRSWIILISWKKISTILKKVYNNLRMTMDHWKDSLKRAMKTMKNWLWNWLLKSKKCKNLKYRLKTKNEKLENSGNSFPG